jgi:hypothetical protein
MLPVGTVEFYKHLNQNVWIRVSTFEIVSMQIPSSTDGNGPTTYMYIQYKIVVHNAPSQ